MATLSEIRTEVRSIVDIGDASLSDSVFNSEINKAIQYYSNRHFWFNEARATITLAADDPVIPDIPADFKRVDESKAPFVLHENINYYLGKVSSDEYDAEDIGTSGIPFIWTDRAGQLLVYFYPDQAYTLYLPYIKAYSTLSSDAATNDFTNYAPALIEAHTKYRMLLSYRFDAELASIWKAIAMDELRELQRQSTARTTTGQLAFQSVTEGYPTYVGPYNPYRYN